MLDCGGAHEIAQAVTRNLGGSGFWLLVPEMEVYVVVGAEDAPQKSLCGYFVVLRGVGWMYDAFGYADSWCLFAKEDQLIPRL
jgi:hypothetical protein